MPSRMTRRQVLIGAAGGLTAVAFAGFFLVDPILSPRGSATERPLPIRKRSPILVLAPHPDDEVLGSGAFWHAMLRQGCEVHVLIATCGDGFPADAERLYYTVKPTAQDYLSLGRRRMQESRTAVSALGLPDRNIQFLGFPDSGTDSLFLYNWLTPYTSRFTRQSADPYEGTISPRVAYTGKNEYDAIYNALRTIKPGVLILPHPNDIHPDHWAMAAFATGAVEQLRQEGEEFVREMAQMAYLVHWGDWPLPFGYHPARPLLPPWEFDHLGTSWYRYPLTLLEVTEKFDAIRHYRSQMEVMARRLDAFARRNELFGVVPQHIVEPWDGSYDRMAAVLHDPPATLVADIFRSASLIRTVSMAKDADHLYLRHEFRDEPPASAILQQFFMGFAPGGYIRARVDVGPLFSPQVWSDSTRLSAMGVSFRVQGRTCDVKVPLALFQGAPDLMFGVIVLRGRRQIGKTAFRVVRLG